MSYILEALKKAQAERNLGNAPTIHAPQPAQEAPSAAAAGRKPLFIGLGAGLLVVALGALFLWQRGTGPAAVPAAPVVPAAAPALAGPAAVPAPAPAAPPASSQRQAATPPARLTASAASNTLEVSAPPAPAPAPHPAHPAEPPARPAAPAAAAAVPAGAGADTLASARTPAPSRAPAPTTAPAPAAPSPEDSLPYLHQLPEQVQRDVPRVSFGGYMYSANPADRLLLVDKTLRHEGEEVGPGLILEKLLPKAAVMNFRGVRYRVAY